MTKEGRDKISAYAKVRYNGHVQIRKCIICKVEFKTTISRIADGRGTTCSRKCKGLDSRGKRISIGTEFKKGIVPWNKGKDFFPKTYKGDKVGNRVLHNWVARKLGKPSLCWHCGTTTAKRFEWSNISRTYKRDLNDYQRLCTRCHMDYDGHSIENNNKKCQLG